MIGLKISPLFSINEKQNQNQWQPACRGDFSRALSKLQVIASDSDWFIALFSPVVIGRSNNFDIVSSQVIGNHSIISTWIDLQCSFSVMTWVATWLEVAKCEVNGERFCNCVI